MNLDTKAAPQALTATLPCLQEQGLSEPRSSGKTSDLEVWRGPVWELMEAFLG